MTIGASLVQRDVLQAFEQASQLALGRVVRHAARLTGRINADVLLPLPGGHLDDGRLPTGPVRFRENPELPALHLHLLCHHLLALDAHSSVVDRPETHREREIERPPLQNRSLPRRDCLSAAH